VGVARPIQALQAFVEVKALRTVRTDLRVSIDEVQKHVLEEVEIKRSPPLQWVFRVPRSPG
jgi:hypothetical protein